MPNTKANTLAVRLNRILRNHLTVVSQLFMHDLIFMQWGEEAIHDRYDAEYMPDISRLFKLLEHMLKVGYGITPGVSGKSYTDDIALVGKSVSEMLDLDYMLLANIQTTICEAANECRRTNDEVAVKLLNEAFETRARLIKWIETQRIARVMDASGPCLVTPDPGEPAHTLWAQINLLICRLLIIIDQTVYHTFAFRHNGDKEAADNTWRISWQSMLDTTAIVKLVIAKGWALDTLSAARANSLPRPVMADNMSNIAALDSALHWAAALVAERGVSLAHQLGETEFKRVLLASQHHQTICAGGAAPATTESYSGLPQMLERWT
jgi:bacterioferritin (cytochrome b1)